MNYAYDWAFRPPMPVLPVTFTALGSGVAHGPVSALVDTGADATIAPEHVLIELKVEPVEVRWLRVVGGSRRQVRLYPVDIRVGGAELSTIEVVGDAYSDEVVLGRDVLNALRLLLDGPAAATELLTG